MLFNKRQLDIIEAALSYASSNVDDINEAFDAGDEAQDCIFVQGHYIGKLDEAEVNELLQAVQTLNDNTEEVEGEIPATEG